MVPKCKVLVYFVKLDREIVADSVEYKVEEKLENQVKITVLKILSLYDRDEWRTLIGSLRVWKKSSYYLKKFIFLSQEIIFVFSRNLSCLLVKTL